MLLETATMSTNELLTQNTLDLFTAAEKDDVNKIKSLMSDENTNINWHNRAKNGATPLHIAVAAKKEKAAAALLELGADVHAKINTDLNTPLHVACMSGNESMMKLLISKGADLNLGNQYGNTPLHSACLQGGISAVKFLLEHGANINEPNHLKSTPLHFACYNDKENVELATFLMSTGASLATEDSELATPLQVAAIKGHAKMCKMFVEGGADPNHYDAQGRTAVSLALSRGHTKLAQALGGSALSESSGLKNVPGGAMHLAQQAAARKASAKSVEEPKAALESKPPSPPKGEGKKKTGGFFRRRK